MMLVPVVPAKAAAQTPIQVQGLILAPTGEPVPSARIEIDGQEPITTDEGGRFQLGLEPGEWELSVSHPAYRLLRHRVTVGTESLDLEFQLEWVTSVEEAITVIGIRAGENVPVTKRNMDREEIETFSYGQDVPELLAHTPSMNWYSDSGIGSNYSYFSMRGIQQTRINMTFDGAAAQRSRGARALLQQFPRLSEHRRQHSDPARCGHVCGRLARIRRLGELRQPGARARPRR